MAVNEKGGTCTFCWWNPIDVLRDLKYPMYPINPFRKTPSPFFSYIVHKLIQGH
jgi:hypothetical protein